MLQVLTEFQLCKHGRHLSKCKCFVDVWRSCLFCQKVIKEKNYRCAFGDSVVHFHSQIHDILNLPVDKQMPWELPCSFPTQQHLYVRRNMIG